MSFTKNVINWYGKNGRNFLWRQIKDPYRVLVTEVMLQRTRAKQVETIWSSFFDKFPKIKSIHNSKLEDIKNEISSLGLIWRGKTLKKMAQKIMEDYSGNIPSNEEIFEIPGVGDYVGNATLCFAFGKRRVLIDSNVVLVISEIFDISYSGEGRRDKKIKKKCSELVPSENCREYHFGLIDIANKLRKINGEQKAKLIKILRN